MYIDLLKILRCPATGAELTLSEPEEMNGEIKSGWLCSGSHRYPICDYIPRFVAESNYADNFGFQWNEFRKTQLDSHSGRPISRDRFVQFTGWDARDLHGKLILDVGCGSGRFTEIARNAGAKVMAVDYSNAIDACRRNLGSDPNLAYVQADLYRLPFATAGFDNVYCLGVLQHTPDVHQAFIRLSQQLKMGGRLAVDLYPKLWQNRLWPRYWLRPVSKRLPPRMLFRWVRHAVVVFLPLSIALGRIPRCGRKLRHIIPIANYDGIYPLSPSQLKEWAVLDTFDMLGPRYDSPQSAETLRAWCEEAGLREIDIFRKGFLVARATK